MSTVDQGDVVVVGCGGIGLPLAVALATVGRSVLGVDSDADKTAKLASGRLDLIDEGLESALRASLGTGRLTFATSLGEADKARIYVIAVPTPASPASGLDERPLRQAMAAVSGAARPGDLVCLRSTLPIGATRALAEAFKDRGLAFAACPDRTVAGAAYAEQFSLPHIVGGLGEDAGARAEALLAPLGSVVRVSDPETAESIKLFANVSRDVTFALANQFALICEATGIDFDAVRRGGAEGFSRFSLARPGPVGGPCLTKDMVLLLTSPGVGEVDTGLLNAARSLNESLADRVVGAIEAALDGKAGSVAILGLAFKANPPTADRRGAFAGALIDRLRIRLPTLEIRFWDPVCEAGAARQTAVSGAAVVVLANDHPDLAMGLASDLAAGAVVFDLTGLIADGAAFDVRRLGDGRR